MQQIAGQQQAFVAVGQQHRAMPGRVSRRMDQADPRDDVVVRPVGAENAERVEALRRPDRDVVGVVRALERPKVGRVQVVGRVREPRLELRGLDPAGVVGVQMGERDV